LGIVDRVEKVVPVAAGLFGLVHGVVGMAQQLVYLHQIVWVQGDTNAG
jgi:hypothetical protein